MLFPSPTGRSSRPSPYCNRTEPRERSKLSWPPCKGETGERSDERNTVEREEPSSPGRPFRGRDGRTTATGTQ